MLIAANLFFKVPDCSSKYFNNPLEKQILFFSYY